MIRLVGWLATLLGRLVRFILLATPVAMWLVGTGLIVYSVWLFEERLAWAAAGMFLLIFIPRRDRRKS